MHDIQSLNDSERADDSGMLPSRAISAVMAAASGAMVGAALVDGEPEGEPAGGNVAAVGLAEFEVLDLVAVCLDGLASSMVTAPMIISSAAHALEADRGLALGGIELTRRRGPCVAQDVDLAVGQFHGDRRVTDRLQGDE